MLPCEFSVVLTSTTGGKHGQYSPPADIADIYDIHDSVPYSEQSSGSLSICVALPT